MSDFPVKLILKYSKSLPPYSNVSDAHLYVAAIIDTESSCNQYAVRYEPKWNYFYKTSHFAKLNKITLETEVKLQAMSWGYMQIMGSVARELGFPYCLPKLTDDELNIKFGCLKIESLFKKYDSWPDVISAYNAGVPKKKGDEYINQVYVNKVLKKFDELKQIQI